LTAQRAKWKASPDFRSEAKVVQFNFDTSDYAAERNGLVAKLKTLAQLIVDEQKLNELRETYASQDAITICTGVCVESGGEPHPVNQLLLPGEQVLSLVNQHLAERIGARRKEIEALWRELAG
jgi:hypothetical protein